ncbi:hypothetical protein B0T25DRAFT_496547, partial [Lasiosphaeria hispida]
DGHGYEQDHLPYFECGDFLRAEVAFPDCWSGKDLTAPITRQEPRHTPLWT